MRYDVQPDDTVTNRREFLDVAGNDGMKVDRREISTRPQAPALARSGSRRRRAEIGNDPASGHTRGTQKAGVRD